MPGNILDLLFKSHVYIWPLFTVAGLDENFV